MIGELAEEVTVPFAPHVGIFVGQPTHNATWETTLRIEKIGVPLEILEKEAAFDAHHVDVAVSACAGGVFILGFVTKRIVAVAVSVGCVDETIFFEAISGIKLVRAKRAN